MNSFNSPRHRSANLHAATFPRVYHPTTTIAIVDKRVSPRGDVSRDRRAKADRKRNYVGDRSILSLLRITGTYLRADGFPSGYRKHIVRSSWEVVYIHAEFNVVQRCVREPIIAQHRHFFAGVQITRCLRSFFTCIVQFGKNFYVFSIILIFYQLSSNIPSLLAT